MFPVVSWKGNSEIAWERGCFQLISFVSIFRGIKDKCSACTFRGVICWCKAFGCNVDKALFRVLKQSFSSLKSFLTFFPSFLPSFVHLFFLSLCLYVYIFLSFHFTCHLNQNEKKKKNNNDTQVKSIYSHCR